MLDRAWRGNVRIALEVMILQHVMPDRRAVLHAEPIAPIVRIAAELRRPALRFEQAGVRANSKIAAADRNLLLCAQCFDFCRGAIIAVMAAARAVNPIVQPPAQAVYAQLLIALLKSRIKLFD